MIERVFARALRCLAVVAAVTIAGCAGNVSNLAAAPEVLSYDETLHQCRKLQPGRLNRRMQAPANHLGVARCLRRQGWQPDGTAQPSQ